MTKIRISVLLVFIQIMAQAAGGTQSGRLLVIGGGSESNSTNTAWNYAAYNWAVSSSNNKKVAVLHYSTTSSWLEDFFVNHCDAEEAKSYLVNQTNANDTDLMETLSGYDVFFFRGGNQWNYYDYYKGTAFQDLVIDKYESGGVICGTSAGLAILSGVVYTAENGTVYSDESLLNIDHPKNTLADDLYPFYPGLIFDSHFTDRGRLGRLIGFLARYEKDTGNSIAGIGVDERTALAIDENAQATVYGMGTVQVVRRSPGNSFSEGPTIVVDSLEITSLIQGNTIDLNTFQTDGFGEINTPVSDLQDYDGILFLTGGDEMSSTNIQMLDQFVELNNTADPILILTTSINGMVTGFSNKLQELGATNVTAYEASYANRDHSGLSTAIHQAKKILFVANSSYQFSLFLEYGANGPLLKERIWTEKPPIAFIGDNSRYATSVVVDNYLTTNGVSQANLLFSEGLGLMKSTVIIPKTYQRASGGITSYWKSTNGSLFFTLIEKNIKNGIWLSSENYLVIRKDGEEIQASVYGNMPVMHLTREETPSDFVTQTYNGLSSEIPQSLAAFQKMWLSLKTTGQTFSLGRFQSTTGIIPSKQGTVNIYPNPTSGLIHYESSTPLLAYTVFSMDGRVLKSVNLNRLSGTIKLPISMPQQQYFIIEFLTSNRQSLTRRVLFYRGD